MSSTVDVPRRFLPRLADEATKSLCNKADDVGICEGHDEPAKLELAIDALCLASRSREAILLARDSGRDAKLKADVLRLPVQWMLSELHYKVSEHDHGDLDQLVRDVEALRDFADWAHENGLAPAEAVTA